MAQTLPGYGDEKNDEDTDDVDMTFISAGSFVLFAGLTTMLGCSLNSDLSLWGVAVTGLHRHLHIALWTFPLHLAIFNHL